MLKTVPDPFVRRAVGRAEEGAGARGVPAGRPCLSARTLAPAWFAAVARSSTNSARRHRAGVPAAVLETASFRKGWADSDLRWCAQWVSFRPEKLPGIHLLFHASAGNHACKQSSNGREAASCSTQVEIDSKLSKDEAKGVPAGLEGSLASRPTRSNSPGSSAMSAFSPWRCAKDDSRGRLLSRSC
jgi:hypothetical protein